MGRFSGVGMVVVWGVCLTLMSLAVGVFLSERAPLTSETLAAHSASSGCVDACEESTGSKCSVFDPGCTPHFGTDTWECSANPNHKFTGVIDGCTSKILVSYNKVNAAACTGGEAASCAPWPSALKKCADVDDYGCIVGSINLDCFVPGCDGTFIDLPWCVPEETPETYPVMYNLACP